MKVADFGIAKIVDEVTQASRSDFHSPPANAFTEVGKVLGTPQYMAPEQISHPADVDHRADIYALGVVFYQMLTGELPGKRLEAPSQKVHIDVRLDEIVLRAMEKDPELRYQTAHEFRTGVDDVEAPAHVLPPSLSQPPPKRGMMRWWWVFLIMFPLGLLIGLAAASVLAYVTPKKYEVSAIIEVKPAAGSVMPPNFFDSQFEALKSKKTMDEVAKQLELPKNWMLSEDAVVQRLREITTTQNIRGTDLISIGVRHTDRQEAAAIVRLVAQHYQRSFPGEVVIHEEPSEPNTSVSPNVRLNLVIGGLLGIILSPLLGIILIAILQRLFPETKTTHSPILARSQKSEPAVKKLSTLGVILLIIVSILILIPVIVGTAAYVWYQTLESKTGSHLSPSAKVAEAESIDPASKEKEMGTISDVQMQAATKWLLGVDAGNYAQSWEDAAESFHRAVTQEQWVEKSDQVRKPLGVLVSRKIAASRQMTTLPGFPEGAYFEAQFDTSFAGLEVAKETLTFSQEKSGQWRVMGYLIKPVTERNAEAVGPPEQAVIDRAEAWLKGIDSGNYARSWQDAAVYFKAAITETGWSDALAKVRKPLGEMSSRKLLSATSAKSLPGAPDGEYLVIQFNTSFAAKANSVETVTYTKEKDGTWKSSGYFIR